jgi:hypothetical protein
MNPIRARALLKLAKRKYEHDYGVDAVDIGNSFVSAKTGEATLYDKHINRLRSYKIEELERHGVNTNKGATGNRTIRTILISALILAPMGITSQLLAYKGSNPKHWRLEDIPAATKSLIGIKTQKRFIVLESVRCNLEFTNNKIRQSDSLFGFDFGGVFGYKTECASNGYSENKSGPYMLAEATAIQLACAKLNYSTPQWLIDALLARGAKLIRDDPSYAMISVYKSKLPTPSEVGSLMQSVLVKGEKSSYTEQPDNSCNGRAVVLEGSPLLLENMRVAE